MATTRGTPESSRGLLVRLGYPQLIIFKKQRSIYLKALRKADAGEPDALGELLARAILASLHRFVLPAVAGPHRLVPLAALADTRITSGALRTAAVRGALDADQGPDGQWRSTRWAVDEYLSRRYQRHADGDR